MIQTILLGYAFAAPSITIESKSSVMDAGKAIIKKAVSYYKPASDGAVTGDSNIDGYGIPWFESAILWEAIMRNAQLSQDETHVGLTVAAVTNSSYGEDASFLGPPNLYDLSTKILGKWNDE